MIFEFTKRINWDDGIIWLFGKFKNLFKKEKKKNDNESIKINPDKFNSD